MTQQEVGTGGNMLLDDTPDYPKFGVWPDGYYMSANLFLMPVALTRELNSAFITVQLCLPVILRHRWFLLHYPHPITRIHFSHLHCDGAFPSLGTPDYFVYMNDGPDYLGVYEFHVDWTNTSNSTFGNYLQLTCYYF